MIYDNVLNLFTNTPLGQIPVAQRGERYIKLTENQITRYNENPNDINYIITGNVTPEPEPTLEDLKLSKMTTLNTNYGAKISNGYTNKGWVFNLDENTLNNIALQTNAYVVDDTDNLFKITDRSKIQREFTRNEFKAFAKEFKNILKPLMEKYSDIKNQIELAENETDLNNINITL